VWLKAQIEMAGIWPHAAMGPVERMVSPHSQREPIFVAIIQERAPR